MSATPMGALIAALVESNEKAARGDAVAFYPEEVAAFMLRTLDDAGFAVLALPQPTGERTTPAGARCATFGEIDATCTERGWWLDHRGSGATLRDSDPHGTGGDYVAALRWIERQRDGG